MPAAVLLGAACTGLADPAGALTMQQKMTKACAADVARFCPADAADPDATKACLLPHRADVDATCMQLIDAAE